MVHFSLLEIDDKSQIFDVHKSILIGRSEVFAAMLLSSELAEQKSKTLTIKDITTDALKEMLRFLYTDEVPNCQIMLSKLGQA